MFSANLYAENIDNNITSTKNSIEIIKDSQITPSGEESFFEIDGNKIKLTPEKKPYSKIYLFKMAIQLNKLDGVREYIDNGGNVNDAIIYKNNSILHMSAMRSQNEMFAYALSKEANLFKLNDSGDSPLHIAAYSHNLSLIKYVFERSDKKTIGALVKLVDSQGKTLLHNALLPNERYEINGELVKYLINLGFDINIQDNLGQTPLHYAALYRSKSLFEYMVSARGNIFIKNIFSRTPIEVGLENMNFFENDQEFYNKFDKSQVNKFMTEVRGNSN